MASGLEVFGVVAGAATLIEVCKKIGNHMIRFKRRAREAHVFATDLHSQVDHVKTCAMTVQRAARSRKRQAGPGEQGKEEIAIWKTIRRTLDRCHQLFQKFEERLEGVAAGKEDLNWFESALLQRRIDIVEPQLLQLEKRIDCCLTTLNTTILSVHLYRSISDRCAILQMLIRFVLSIIQTSNHDHLTSMFANAHVAVMKRLEMSLEKGENQLRSSAHTAHQTNLPDGSSQNDEPWYDLKIALETGSVVRTGLLRQSVASTVQMDALDGGSTFSRNTGDHQRLPGTRSSSISSASMSNGGTEHMVDPKRFTVDQTPYFDDTTPQEVLDALIVGLRERVKFETDRHQGGLAAPHLSDTILHLEELYIGYGTMEFAHFRDVQSQLRNQLSEIYVQQQQYDEAYSMIGDNLQLTSKPAGTILPKAPTMVGAGVDPSDAMSHYLLALICHEKYRATGESLYLEAAEREAKRAFKCSEKGREADPKRFKDTVSVLIQIYEDKGKMVHADTYRSLYLSPEDDPKLPEVPLDLIDAVIADRFELVKHRLIGMDLELRRDGKTALMYAVERENVIITRKLLHAGAKVDDAFLYALKNKKANMTQLLLKLDAPREIKDDQGATPLLIAVTSADTPTVQQLLDRGVVVNAQDHHGWSVVHIAAQKGNAEIMRILLKPDYHVNLNAVCAKGKTALHYLAEPKQSNVAIAKMLLEANADAGIKDNSNRTPLDIAAKLRRYSFVETLLNYNINAFDLASLKVTCPKMENLIHNAEQTSRRASSVTSDGQSSGQAPKVDSTTQNNENSRLGRLRFHGFRTRIAGVASK